MDEDSLALERTIPIEKNPNQRTVHMLVPSKKYTQPATINPI